MNYKWLNKTDSDNLIIFFNGWGMDESVVAHLDFDGYDVLMFYDYNSLDTDFDFTILSRYKSKHTVAWSMGVMIATILSFESDTSCAIAGTPYPIDNNYGIPKRIYNLTVRGFNEDSATKFIERMFLTKPEGLKVSNRNLENQREELKSLMGYSPNPDYRYTRVIIPTDDIIIPTKNQQNYWSGFDYELVTSAHCPFMLYNKWSELI